MKRIEVVAAIVEHGDRYLCVRKGVTRYEYTSNVFEFPGGKVEPAGQLTGQPTGQPVGYRNMKLSNISRLHPFSIVLRTKKRALFGVFLNLSINSL